MTNYSNNITIGNVDWDRARRQTNDFFGEYIEDPLDVAVSKTAYWALITGIASTALPSVALLSLVNWAVTSGDRMLDPVYQHVVMAYPTSWSTSSYQSKRATRTTWDMPSGVLVEKSNWIMDGITPKVSLWISPV